MPYDLSDKLVVGVSSRALFDLEEEERIWRRFGPQQYRDYQLDREEEVLDAGTAFPLIRGLLNLNALAPERRVEVIVISRNNPETALRIFRSIDHYGLDITRAAFAGGEPLNPYLKAFAVDLFLSSSLEDVRSAIDSDIAAAVLYKPPSEPSTTDGKLRIAFDADAVIFSEESEAFYQAHGTEKYKENERTNARVPLAEGPLARLLRKLHALQEGFSREESPLRLAIVTARNGPAHERVIRTLRQWNVRVDAAFFLGGIAKDDVLAAFGAHIFFDDQEGHLAPAAQRTPSALVPYRTDSVLRKPPPPADPLSDEGEAVG